MNRPHIIIHTIASVDGRVSLGPNRTGFEDVADDRWKAIWASDTALEESVLELAKRYRPQVFLEGSGSFVTEETTLTPLPPTTLSPTILYEDYLPESIVDSPNRVGWFAAVDGRGRLRAGFKEFPGWDGWHTLHLVARKTPVDYLAFLREREIPYLVAGEDKVDLQSVLGKMHDLLGIQKIVSTAGSRLNGALLRADLVDELSLILLPALIGGSATPSLFQSPDLTPDEWPSKLVLRSVRSEKSGRVHLHYTVSPGRGG